MSRPKANTEAGKIAVQKWRESMKQKYGDGLTERMKEIGRKGGKAGFGPDYTGGFANSREIASTAGRKGGIRGRRGFKFIKELDENKALYLNKKTNEEVVLQYGVSIYEKASNI